GYHLNAPRIAPLSGPSAPTVTFFASFPPHPPGSTLFPYTTLFRSGRSRSRRRGSACSRARAAVRRAATRAGERLHLLEHTRLHRSEEHTSELQSLAYVVCRPVPDKNNDAVGTAPMHQSAVAHTWTE